jgi:hypothetical protein
MRGLRGIGLFPVSRYVLIRRVCGLPETHSVYTALVPHGNIISVLLHEQNAILCRLSAFETRAVFQRFMPLCLFLREDFETAAGVLAARKRKSAAPVVIMPPALARNMIVYPAQLDAGLTPVIPPFLERCLPRDSMPREKNECGFVTAFAPFSPVSCGSGAIYPAPIIQCAERAITVCKLCRIEFIFNGLCAWEWRTGSAKWIKFKN